MSKQEATDQAQETPVTPEETTEAAKEAVLEETKADIKELMADEEEAEVAKAETEVDPIEALQVKYDELEDSYLRAQAEIKNMQARHQKEQAQLLKYDGQALAKAVLPVIDNLERALATKVTDENGEQLKKGVQMTYDHMKTALKENGIEEIQAAGQPFDPTIHQAVQTVAVEGDQKADTVVQVFQKGYYLKDRVLRPAMVVVAQ